MTMGICQTGDNVVGHGEGARGQRQVRMPWVAGALRDAGFVGSFCRDSQVCRRLHLYEQASPCYGVRQDVGWPEMAFIKPVKMTLLELHEFIMTYHTKWRERRHARPTEEATPVAGSDAPPGPRLQRSAAGQRRGQGLGELPQHVVSSCATHVAVMSNICGAPAAIAPNVACQFQLTCQYVPLAGSILYLPLAVFVFMTLRWC